MERDTRSATTEKANAPATAGAPEGAGETAPGAGEAAPPRPQLVSGLPANCLNYPRITR